MGDSVKGYLQKLKLDRANRMRIVSILCVLSILVAGCVTWNMRIKGIAKTCETTCGMTEHRHTEDCIKSTLVCQIKEGHIHTADCYKTVYTCGFAPDYEHIHTAMCYADIGADVESAEDWEKTLPPAEKLTGRWQDDLIAVAKSQIGYTQSQRNYIVDDTTGNCLHYTRYSAWYSDGQSPYGAWNTAFAAFCVKYAGLTEDIALCSTGCNAWTVNLERLGFYKSAKECMPSVGDLAFFDIDSDGKADVAGIVEKADKNAVVTIEGDVGGKVDTVTRSIFPIGLVPVSQLYNKALKSGTLDYSFCTVKATADDGVEFVAEGLLPHNSVLKVKALGREYVEHIGKVANNIPSEKKAFAYDIKIYSDDREIKINDTIAIYISGVKIGKDKKVNVYHLKDTDIKDVPDLTSESINAENLEVSNSEDSINFNTDGCSVFYFTVEFTVDFSYNGMTYSIGGQSDGISLTQLMSNLCIDRTIDKVTNVTFEGDATKYVTVEKTYDDWQISPNGKPFDVYGYLTVYFEDETSIVITVSDYNINGTAHFYQGDTLVGKSGGLTDKNHIADNAVVYIHGTVYVKDVTYIGKNVKFILASDFAGEKIDGYEVALKYTNSGAYLRTENIGSSGLTVTSECKGKPFVFDGGGVSRGSEESLIRWGFGTSWIIAGSLNNCPLSLTDVVFQNCYNTKRYMGDWRQTGGGAIIFTNRSGDVTMTNVTVKNCYHTSNASAFFFYNAVGSTSKVTCTMTDCLFENNSVGNDGVEPYGGVIKTTGTTSMDLIMNNCVFRNNTSATNAGAVFWNVSSELGSLIANDCQFTNNRCVADGGAISNQGVMILNRCTFTGNKAKNGGAIRQNVYGGHAGGTIFPRYDRTATSLYIDKDTIIKENVAEKDSQGSGGNGGGIYFLVTQSDTVSNDMTLMLEIAGQIIENSAATNGGGVYFSKSTNATYDTNIIMSGGTVNKNKATGNGGGIYFTRDKSDRYKADIDLNDGTISQNTAKNGGGLYCNYTNVNFGTTGKMVISENTAANGGGLYVRGSTSNTNFKGDTRIEFNTAKGAGGGIYVCDGATLEIIGGLINNNRAVGDGSAITSGLTTYNNANSNKGVGGGVYLHSGYFKLGDGANQTEIKPVGIWGNTAALAADDLYTSGTDTYLDVPDSKLMTLYGYYDPDDVNWVEDFSKNEPSYSKWTGATVNKGRYRELEITEESGAVYINPYKMNTPNSFVCATIGPVKWIVNYYNSDGTSLLKGPAYYNHTQLIEVETVLDYRMWTTKPNGEGSVYNAGDRFQILNNINFYAKEVDAGALKIVKTVDKVDGALAPPVDDVFTFTVTLPQGTYGFTVYSLADYSVVGSGTVQTSGTVELKGGQYALFNNLPAGTQYSVTEASHKNYTTASSNTVGTIATHETSTAVFTNTYTLKTITANLKIFKSNSSHEALKGAVFTLSQKKDGQWAMISNTLTSNEDGIIDCGKIESEKIYELTETVSPQGYVLLNNSIYFKLTENGVELCDAFGDTLTTVPEYVLVTDSDGTLNIINSVGFVLPESGGKGYTVLAICGLSLMTVSLAIGCITRRRKEGRLKG